MFNECVPLPKRVQKYDWLLAVVLYISTSLQIPAIYCLSKVVGQIICVSCLP